VIVAETVFGERSIDLVREPQWIVALVHSCICAPRLVNVASPEESEFNFVINKNVIAIFWTTISFLDNRAFARALGLSRKRNRVLRRNRSRGTR